ncbi:MAG: PAS domain S-box protein, partial [Gemmatimonadales bacterium]
MRPSPQDLQRPPAASFAIRTPWGRALAVVLATATAAALSFALAPSPGSLPPIWLPTAVAVVAAFFWGPLVYPAVIAGVMLGLAGRGPGPLLTLVGGATDGAIGLVGARLLHSLRFRPAIDRLREVWSLAASVAVLASLATALELLLRRSIPLATALPPPGDWYTVGAARLLGFAALAPALFSWGAPVSAPAPLASRRGEMAGLALATAGIAWLAFAVLPLPSRYGLPGILVLCLAWAATRGHQRAASLVTLAVTLAALALIRGQAIEVVQPFDVTVEGPLSRFAISMALFSVVGLVLAAAMLEREISVRREDRTSKVLGALYHDTPLGMTATDAERRLTVWNPAAERLYGWRPEEVLGQLLPESGESMPGSARRVEEELSAGRPVVGLETRRQRKDGSWLDVRLTMTPVRDDAGRLVQVITLHEDISDRRRREESLREEEAKYRLVFEAASDAMFLHDPATLRILDVNPATEALYGYSRDELLAMTSLDLSAEPDETRATIRQAAERGSVHVPLRLHRHREGHLLPVEITGGRLPWQGRTIAITIVRDIRRRMTEEQDRRDREAYLQAVLEHASDIVTILDSSATIRWGSPSITRLLGYRLEEVVGQPMAAFIHPDDLPAVAGAMQRIVGEPGRVGTVLSRFRHKDGSWRQLESVGRYLPDTPGIKGVLVNARDATDRLEMEARNQRSRQRFEVVANATNDVVWEWDIAGKSSWWSEGLTRVFGWRPGQLERDQDWADRIHPDDLVRANGTLQESVDGDVRWKCEYRFRRADGRYAIVLDQAWSTVRDAQGRAVRMIGAMTDLTERREAERLLAESREQLRQATKMEAMGRLAGGIAHDFNNILTSLLGHTDLALAQGGEDEALHEDLQEIRAAGLRAAGLTQQLLAFSRKQVLEPRVVNLNEVVSSVHRMLARV